MNDRHQNHIDQIIEEALRAGKFDNLPGKGKPLDLSEHPFEDPTMRMTHRMLKDNGFSLPWIENRKAFEADLESARKQINTTWQWVKRQKEAGYTTPFIDEEWTRAQEKFTKLVESINKKIASYNLEIPNIRFERMPLNAQAEIAHIQAG